MTLHQNFMLEALKEAGAAGERGEIPVGAVVVCGGEIVGRGSNRTVEGKEPTLHAEIVAIRDACQRMGRGRLEGCSLYVTLEPCPMCAGAIVLARLDKLLFGAFDSKAGAAGTLYSIPTDSRLNHTVETLGGILDRESRELLQEFFRDKRSTTIP